MFGGKWTGGRRLSPTAFSSGSAAIWLDQWPYYRAVGQKVKIFVKNGRDEVSGRWPEEKEPRPRIWAVGHCKGYRPRVICPSARAEIQWPNTRIGSNIQCPGHQSRIYVVEVSMVFAPHAFKAFFIWGLAFYESQPHEARVYEVMFPSFATIKEFFFQRRRQHWMRSFANASPIAHSICQPKQPSQLERSTANAAHPDMVEATSIYLGSCLVHHWHLGRDWLGFRSAFSSNDTVNVGMREIFKDGAIQRVRYLVTWFDRVETDAGMGACDGNAILATTQHSRRHRSQQRGVLQQSKPPDFALSSSTRRWPSRCEPGNHMLVELAEKEIMATPLVLDALADLRRHSDASLAIRIDYVCDTFAAASGLASPNDPTYESLEIAKLSPYRELQQVFAAGLKRLLDRLPGVELDKWAFQSPEVFAAGFKAAKPTMNEIAALVHCLHDGWRGKPGEENSSYCEYLMIQEIASEVVEKMGDCKIVALRPENLAP
ncbi:hypothetical protein BKA62DRAFT_669180 [Auriculariales sp. MPI-PUGE-AT-0066]|nr:hypothetical protein BKA62DRAFT_669180 [Auriculariales sp. MPI-PUGE-AT-0066]